MPIDSFKNLWHTPGFKYEYCHGRANISVQRSASPIVAARPSMIEEAAPSSSTSIPEDVVLEDAASTSTDDLMELWLDTFMRTPHYYGYRAEHIRKEASEILNSLYDDASHDLHSASVIARWRGRLVGMLLVSEARTRPLVEALGVRPDIQHRGVGRAMAGKVAKRLRAADEDVLCSGYLLANAKSAAWHEALGFVEIPDWLTTGHRFRCAQHNLKRGLARDVFGMRHYVETLRNEVDRMSQDRDEDSSAHSPFRWIKTDGRRIDDFLQNVVGE